MKSKKTLVILSVLLILLIGGASALYNKLGDKVESQQLAAQTPQTTQTASSSDNSSEQSAEKIVAPDFTVYDIDGNPSPGDFSCVAYPIDDGRAQVLLPRQLDSSLLLQVDDQAPHLKTFAIGEYLAAGGYDWTAEELSDVTVVLDYSMNVISVKMAGWDKEDIYNVIL